MSAKVFDRIRNKTVDIERATDEWQWGAGWACYSCPVCGVGVTGRLDGPIVAHKKCYDSLVAEAA